MNRAKGPYVTYRVLGELLRKLVSVSMAGEASTRTKVEHPSGIVTGRFRFRMVHYYCLP